MKEAQLMEQLKQLARQRGRVKAAQLLGVNFRTLAASIESGKLSRRMREALQQMAETDEALGDPAGDAEDDGGELAQRVDTLEKEVGDLRQTMKGQEERASELTQRLKKLEAAQREVKRADPVEGLVVGIKADEPSVSELRQTSPLVLTLEPQDEEAKSLGPAAALVKEWRMLRTGENATKGRVERAKAEERRWEVEIALIEEFGLTLPPETTPLNATDRKTHLSWRRATLERARGARIRAEWFVLARRVLTLGLWWR